MVVLNAIYSVCSYYSCNNGLCLVLSYARVLNNYISLGTLSVNVNRQPVIDISYMVSEVWLVSACSLPHLLTSRPLMNGPGGSTDLSSFAPCPVCQPKVTTDKSVPYCTAWGKMQRIPSLLQHLQRRSEDDFFKVRNNVIFEQVQLNRHCQGESEPAEQFITSLYHLAENCEYGDLKD